MVRVDVPQIVAHGSLHDLGQRTAAFFFVCLLYFLIGLLIKIKTVPETRSEIRDITEVFKAKIIDYSAGAMCIEITGDSNKIDAFIDNVKPFGIIEMCRTGIVALERGPESMLEK